MALILGNNATLLSESIPYLYDSVAHSPSFHFLFFFVSNMRFPLLVALSLCITISNVVNAIPCNKLSDTKAVDECYMKIALDYALIHNPQFPFGALIVDHTKNDISCYGANSNKKNRLLHGKHNSSSGYV